MDPYTHEEWVFVYMVLPKDMLKTKRKSNQASIAVSKLEQASAKTILRFRHIRFR